MADETTVETAAEESAAPEKTTAKKTAARKTAAKKAAPAKKTAARRTSKKAVAAAETPGEGEALPIELEPTEAASVEQPAAPEKPARKTAAKRTASKRGSRKAAADAEAAAPDVEAAPDDLAAVDETPVAPVVVPALSALFQAPDPTKAAPARKRTRKKVEPEPELELLEDEDAVEPIADEAADEAPEDAVDEDGDGDDTGEGGERRRRRRRGGRRRRKSGQSADDAGENDEDENDDEEEDGSDEEQAETSGSSRRRRRRRRSGDSSGENGDDPENTVVRVRASRSAEDQITAVSGSTRLEAKKQRRREGREAGRRRAPIVSEAEFLARRESVERIMVIRQRDDLTQIAVLEDKVLVEHYVARESQTSLIGNVYLGRVQNVLPSMEAAFVDIGKGRNAVLYAGEVNWAALGHREGQQRKIESVLSPGQPVLVQVTKDPIGHKGARLTSQISLAGRFLVYVPDGTTSGISRKLPDTERNRLKTLLREIVPDTAGVIVRTAAEGASEEELTHDVERLKARWEDIDAKAKSGNAPKLLYGEPDLTLKVVRDLFTEDFAKLVIQGGEAWDTVKDYVDMVAPDLGDRVEQFVPEDGRDAFATYRVDEQIAKGLDRKVWLPSGGSLIIDRTEAMTVVDVNTGKFTGSGGNLEETVTKNNLEAAEEIVRQLRLRDIGGIIVVDFIDMVLESNRDLVLRRLVECLGRDRTRHQVAEVTSLGLVQMTRKRIGTGLVEAFSETCDHCAGRGILVHEQPVAEGKSSGVLPDEPRRARRRGRGRGGASDEAEAPKAPTPAEFAAMVRHEDQEDDDYDTDEAVVTATEVSDEVVESAGLTTGAPAELAAEADETDTTASDGVAETPAVKVVTRTRRRGASRPAGGTTEAAPIVIAETPVAEAPVVAEVAAPEPPKVITRTRRGASRPAGATVADPGAADGPVDASTDAPAAAEPAASGEGVLNEEDGLVPEHVPVKKRGARKR